MARLIARSAFAASVLVFIALLFVATNLPWRLDDFDQAKQAFTSFEMVQQNHWLYQHTPNGWVATKPPLVGWISASIFFASRNWEIAWLLPSLLAAAALVYLIWRAADRAYDRFAAILAASAVGLNLFAPRLATLARTDMPLALVIAAIGILIWDKIRRRELWTSRDRVLLFALLASGMLIKGPIIYAFLLPGILLFQWHERRRLNEFTAWCGWWPWILSFAVFFAWLLVGIFFVPEFTEHVVLREFLGRFNQGVHRAQPFYFYLPHLLHRFAPWSLLLIGGAIVSWRAREKISSETFWLIAWSVGGLIVMSFVPSKRVDRIFPVVPPLCLSLAAQIAHFRAQERFRRTTERCCAIALAVACIFSGGYSIGRIVVGYREGRNAFAVFGREVQKETEARRLRFELVGGEDESMLLYLRKLSYLEPTEAIAEWNAHELDALVIPSDEWQNVIPRLQDSIDSRLGTSGVAGDFHKRYRLLERE